jgi:hypothetical protein
MPGISLSVNHRRHAMPAVPQLAAAVMAVAPSANTVTSSTPMRRSSRANRSRLDCAATRDGAGFRMCDDAWICAATTEQRAAGAANCRRNSHVTPPPPLPPRAASARTFTSSITTAAVRACTWGIGPGSTNAGAAVPAWCGQLRAGGTVAAAAIPPMGMEVRLPTGLVLLVTLSELPPGDGVTGLVVRAVAAMNAAAPDSEVPVGGDGNNAADGAPMRENAGRESRSSVWLLDACSNALLVSRGKGGDAPARTPSSGGAARTGGAMEIAGSASRAAASRGTKPPAAAATGMGNVGGSSLPVLSVISPAPVG